MQRLLSLVLVFAVLRLGLAQAPARPSAVPLHTEVEIELLDNLSSESLHAGQPVSFKVVKPVALNGTTIIPANMPVLGEVKTAQASGAWHKAGRFDLILKAVKLHDGTLVQLDFPRPKLRGRKAEKVGTAVGTGMLLTYYFPLIPVALISGARKGQAYNIRAGERYLVYVTSSERPAGAVSSDEVPAPHDITDSAKP